ncbi:serine hydrolase [Polaribacter pacificus]|uniref:Serine hydrolase n=1 Tax=Polaribacter pacificus TaxID=1775173 RepID=A0A917HWG2_9FLAO|nr:serine hydrolase [Polaribacter pacificus]GGG92124.1 serine hydrolase [Polaribacter pacificus]
MKYFKKTVVLLLTVILLAVFFNYPKLNIIAGYAAKNTASSVFLADRSLAFTDSTDNNFSPINLASNYINQAEKFATSSAFGLLTRKAIYREGLGAVLSLKKSDQTANYKTPKRAKADLNTAFPYGSANPKDSLFKEVNYTLLNNAITAMFEPENKTRAVVVVYKNHIIAEKYAEGFTKDSKILGWSMTKSITGTIFGILQSRGLLNVQDKAPIAAWKDDERSAITIHNLLQMNSGLEWDENYNEISDATKMLFLERDMTQQQIHKPLAGKPNQSWNYSSGTTNLLSRILRQQFKNHQDYLDFWYTELIDKIGMSSMTIETDLAGNYVGSSYAWATPRDWAKFGLLYLHKGNWNGAQIFNASWVDYATTPTPTSDGWYGAQFWLNAGNRFPDVPKNMFAANGYQGQNVYIFPDNDLVIVRMGLSKNADENEFMSHVLSSINAR